MNSILGALFVLTAFAVGIVRGEESAETFSKGGDKQNSIPYLVTKPDDFEAQQEYPLIIFLHGRGESGDDLKLVKVHGPFKKAKELQLPVLIVAPQTPIGKNWDIDMLSALVDHLLEELPVDRKRVYLTGLSLGGYGTWNLAAQRPELFAAIAPICGGGDPLQADNLKELPIWAFHGAKDSVVPLKNTADMINALYNLGSDARFTVYSDANHDSWTETYNNPAFYEWLLSQKKED
ncbi:carboxylesterase family protein [Bythopirellula polymerisocia]|uniref:Esterase n=1 Tax=Bythopirellula polymerisocia TaxID=2528003 RepID=A0A5C6C9J4_9BACT|nr:prolyl oligopeptidase family serine peptidase [Bythopirellula polymerisocia]TWU20822.1 esterase [Bythopirellula polymerisocia]